MTWTYASNFTLQRDRIRLLIGDTESGDQLLSDEEIAVYAAGGPLEQANDYYAAARCCDDLASKFARRVSLSAGGTSVALDRQAQAYRERARALRQDAVTAGIAPFIGGVSRDDKDAREDDDDRVEPAFTRQAGDGSRSWRDDEVLL